MRGTFVVKSLRINGAKYLIYVKLKIIVYQTYRSNSVKKVLTIYHFLVNISFIKKGRCLDAYNVEGSHLRMMRCCCNYRSVNWTLAGGSHHKFSTGSSWVWRRSTVCTIRSEFSRACLGIDVAEH